MSSTWGTMGGQDTKHEQMTRDCYLEGLWHEPQRSLKIALDRAHQRSASLPRLRRSLGKWVVVETAAALLALLWEASQMGWSLAVWVTIPAALAWAGFLWWVFDIHLPLVRQGDEEPLSAFGLPNALTTLRMLFVPPMILFLSRPQAFGDKALAILVGLWAIGLTDLLDGQIARRFHWTTVFGKDVDPVADIVVTSSTTLALAWAGIFPWWLAGLVAFRYLGALFGFLLLLLTAKPVHIRGTIAGKMTTPSVQVLSFVLAYDHLASRALVSERVEGILALAVGLIIVFNIGYLVWYAFLSDTSTPANHEPLPSGDHNQPKR